MHTGKAPTPKTLTSRRCDMPFVKIAAPIAGLNTTGAVVASITPIIGAYNPVSGSNNNGQVMPNQALILDNLIPSTGAVTNRLGANEHATGVGVGNVDSLFELEALTVSKFIAASGGGFYDVSTVGVSTMIASGYSNDQWQGTVFDANLCLVNGEDRPQIYNGTTFSNMSLTGPPDITQINNILAYKNRLYYGLNNSQDFWYGGLNDISGALTKFPLSMLGNFGGNLVGFQTLTRDGGLGQEDQFCFFMSTGEVIVYQGTDPGTDFVLVGIYKIGRPITQRAIVKFGPDVFVVTNEGYVPLSALLPLSFGQTNQDIEFAIKGAASKEAAKYFQSFGWQVVLSPSDSLLIVNVPQTSNKFIQHVLNVNTLSWCRFTGLNARCWATFGNDLYFGTTDGQVAKYGPLYTDFGAEYTSTYQSPYLELFEGKFQTTSFYPHVQYTSSATLSIQSSTDFMPLTTAYTTSYGGIGTKWGDPWGGPWNKANASINFFDLPSIGYTLSLLLKFTTASQMSFYKTDFIIKDSVRN